MKEASKGTERSMEERTDGKNRKNKNNVHYDVQYS